MSNRTVTLNLLDINYIVDTSDNMFTYCNSKCTFTIDIVGYATTKGIVQELSLSISDGEYTTTLNKPLDNTVDDLNNVFLGSKLLWEFPTFTNSKILNSINSFYTTSKLLNEMDSALNSSKLNSSDSVVNSNIFSSCILSSKYGTTKSKLETSNNTNSSNYYFKLNETLQSIELEDQQVQKQNLPNLSTTISNINTMYTKPNILNIPVLLVCIASTNQSSISSTVQGVIQFKHITLSQLGVKSNDIDWVTIEDPGPPKTILQYKNNSKDSGYFKRNLKGVWKDCKNKLGTSGEDSNTVLIKTSGKWVPVQLMGKLQR